MNETNKIMNTESEGEINPIKFVTTQHKTQYIKRGPPKQHAGFSRTLGQTFCLQKVQAQISQMSDRKILKCGQKCP